jgi:hypothetical protein
VAIQRHRLPVAPPVYLSSTLLLQNKIHSPVAIIGDNKTEAVITLPKTANANQKQEVSHGK